jgi:hypothetical protein
MIGSAKCFVTAPIHRGKKFKLASKAFEIFCKLQGRKSFFLSTLRLFKSSCQMRSSRCQGAACALRRSSSACDGFGPTRRITNRQRFSKKMVLFEEHAMQHVGGIARGYFVSGG